jgi:hypothetical protein
MIRKSIAVAGLAAAGLLGGVAAPAFAAGGPQSGQITGTVTVAESLTLNLANTTFTVNGATPGQSYNGIPATQATVYTNDSTGYLLSMYMNDGAENGVQGPGQCTYPAAFETTNDTFAIPDNAWTDTSTGGPGAAGGTFANPVSGTGNGESGQNFSCSQGTNDVPLTIGQSNGMSAGAGDVFTEQLAVTVPANTPANDTFTGQLTVLAVAS